MYSNKNRTDGRTDGLTGSWGFIISSIYMCVSDSVQNVVMASKECLYTAGEDEMMYIYYLHMTTHIPCTLDNCLTYCCGKRGICACAGNSYSRYHLELD